MHPIELWERNDKYPYPRDMVRLNPPLKLRGVGGAVNSRADVLRVASKGEDIFLGVFSEDQKRSKVYDCIFLDVDSDPEEDSYRKLRELFESLRKYVEDAYVVYSGSKGYHVYIPIIPVKLRDYSGVVRRWLRELGVLDRVDAAAIEPSRISRVVGTVNGKSGKTCRYVGTMYDFLSMTYEETLESHIDMIKLGSSDISDMLRAYDMQVNHFDTGTFDSSGIVQDAKTYPACMEALIIDAYSGVDLNHYERHELGKFLMRVNHGDVDKTARMYSRMSDFDVSVTAYQLSYIRRRDLKVSRCDKLIDMAMCPYVDAVHADEYCPYYPTMNAFLLRGGK